MSEFTGDLYRQTALERAGALQILYDLGKYSLALYAAGLAVEAIFRAYLVKLNPEFDSRHDLKALATDSRFADSIPDRLQEEFAANLGMIAARWSNNHRFRSDDACLKYLNRAGLYRGVKGDVLKENTRKAINAAIAIVFLGDRRWTN